MPRPEQLTPQAPASDATAQPDQQGQTTDVGTQALAANSPIAPQDAQLQPQLPVQPQLPPQDINGGYDSALFAPTDRPNEPITHGAPFGPGASFIPHPAEDTFTFMNRVADQLSQTPDAQGLAPYIDAIRKGQ